jgi:L,D-transpeptidase catalytic domain
MPPQIHRRRSRPGTGLSFALALACLAAPAIAGPPLPAAVEGLIARLASAAPNLDPRVLGLALRARDCAQQRGAIPPSELLTVIDYTRPSTEPRLFVIDVEHGALLHRELVAHGKQSGGNLTTRFSNDAGSRASSLGLFLTLDTYMGSHGRSLRLAGLEPGVNDHAYDRDLVVHGASYVGERFAAKHGRLGRSWGCPALAPEVAQRVIDRIRGGTPVFAYYPDSAWLDGSPFLGRCEAAPPAPLQARATN